MDVYLTPHNQGRVRVKVKDKKWETADCLIDTGFSSGLALSSKFLSKFSLKPIAKQDFELADGSIAPFNLYKTKVKFKNTQKETLVIFTASEDNLAGLEFLKGFTLLFDLKNFKISLK